MIMVITVGFAIFTSATPGRVNVSGLIWYARCLLEPSRGMRLDNVLYLPGTDTPHQVVKRKRGSHCARVCVVCACLCGVRLFVWVRMFVWCARFCVVYVFEKKRIVIFISGALLS